MVDPFAPELFDMTQEEIDLAWELLEGTYAITEWLIKMAAPEAECIDFDVATDPWADVKVNFKTG